LADIKFGDFGQNTIFQIKRILNMAILLWVPQMKNNVTTATQA